ncbi:hypothetical protein BDV30DRAFT_218448, partial [Aspergillus minisclerotigenes]
SLSLSLRHHSLSPSLVLSPPILTFETQPNPKVLTFEPMTKKEGRNYIPHLIIPQYKTQSFQGRWAPIRRWRVDHHQY